jgi:hypothetical protein
MSNAEIKLVYKFIVNFREFYVNDLIASCDCFTFPDGILSYFAPKLLELDNVIDNFIDEFYDEGFTSFNCSEDAINDKISSLFSKRFANKFISN